MKLNLLSPRVIANAADMEAFKREAAAAVLRFSRANPCDLEAVAETLDARYAEIQQALSEGFKVESEVEVYPLDPVTSAMDTETVFAWKPGDMVEVVEDANRYRGQKGKAIRVFTRESGPYPGELLCEVEMYTMRGPQKIELPVSALKKLGSLKQACMQRISAGPKVEAEDEEALAEKPVEPAETVFGGGDPLDAMIAMQERAEDENQFTVEDMLSAMKSAPDKRAVSAAVISLRPALGDRVVYSLLARIASPDFTGEEMSRVRESLKILGALPGELDPEDEENPDIEAESEEKAAVAEVAEGPLPDAGLSETESKELREILGLVNEQLSRVHPDDPGRARISEREILEGMVHGQEIEARIPERGRLPEEKSEVIEESRRESAFADWMAFIRDLAAPALKAQSAVALKEFFGKSHEVHDWSGIANQWYTENGIDPVADTLKGISTFLDSKNITDVNAQEILQRVWKMAPEAVYPLHLDLVERALEFSGKSEAEESAEERVLRKQVEELETRAPAAETERRTAPPSGHILRPISEYPERFSEESRKRYKFEVVSPSGKVEGYYPTEADARMDYPSLRAA